MKHLLHSVPCPALKVGTQRVAFVIPSPSSHPGIMDMHQSPRTIGGTLKDLRLTALRVVRSTIQFRGVARPVELRPSAVTIDRDLQAALLQLTLGEISAKKTHHQLVTNGMIGGVITGGSDKRYLIPMRPDAVHERRVTPEPSVYNRHFLRKKRGCVKIVSCHCGLDPRSHTIRILKTG